MPRLYQRFAGCQFHECSVYFARLKDDGLITIHEYAILYMEPHGLSKNPALYVPSLTDQVFDSIAMVALYNILRNNWPFVQVLCYVITQNLTFRTVDKRRGEDDTTDYTSQCREASITLF